MLRAKNYILGIHLNRVSLLPNLMFGITDAVQSVAFSVLGYLCFRGK